MPSFAEGGKMRRILLLTCLLLTVFLLGSVPVLAQIDYPEPRGYVNDFANIISDDVEQKMEASLRDYEAKTTNEIAVVTVASLEGLSIENYTMGLAEKWGVGKADKDNGIVLLVAPKERKVRVEVGYGLEPVLTDSKAMSVIDAMTPYFKESKYTEGIEVGVKKITDIIGYLTPEELKIQQQEKAAQDKANTMLVLKIFMWIGISIVFIVVFIILWKKISAWNKERKRLNDLRAKITLQIPSAKKQAQDAFTELSQTAAKIKSKYLPHHHKMADQTVARGQELLQQHEKILGEVSGLITNNPDSAADKFAKTSDLRTSIKWLEGDLAAFNQRPRNISEGVKGLEKRIEVISGVQAKSDLDHLKMVAPILVWTMLETDLNVVESTRQEIRTLLNAVKERDLVAQNFDLAEANLKSAKTLTEKIERNIAAPGKTLREFLAAKDNVPGLKKRLDEKLGEAEAKRKDSDAGDEPQKILKEARDKKSEADRAEKEGPTNWLVVYALLMAAVALADKSRTEAESNINAAHLRRDSYHRSSNWSSSSYSHSSSSFGGFGGGGFGGGGASGGW